VNPSGLPLKPFSACDFVRPFRKTVISSLS
jgi:hypothetical protein